MRKMDMLHGSIGDKTVSFAILLAVTGICQQLFNAIDIIIMGRFVGKEAMAAVGSNAPVVGLLVTFFPLARTSSFPSTRGREIWKK